MLTSRPLEGTPRLVQVWPCSWRSEGTARETPAANPGVRLWGWRHRRWSRQARGPAWGPPAPGLRWQGRQGRQGCAIAEEREVGRSQACSPSTPGRPAGCRARWARPGHCSSWHHLPDGRAARPWRFCGSRPPGAGWRLGRHARHPQAPGSPHPGSHGGLLWPVTIGNWTPDKVQSSGAWLQVAPAGKVGEWTPPK